MNLNFSNRLVRIRLLGGVGGAAQVVWAPLSRSRQEQRHDLQYGLIIASRRR